LSTTIENKASCVHKIRQNQYEKSEAPMINLSMRMIVAGVQGSCNLRLAADGMYQMTDQSTINSVGCYDEVYLPQQAV